VTARDRGRVRDTGTDIGTDILKAGAEAIARAAELIRAGDLVAFPTETVYGLGADATSDGAIAAVFAAKDRPTFNPLIVHFADARGASRRVAFDERARLLAKSFWPGPLTLVLPRREACRISMLASSGLDTLAVRVPGHLVALKLLAAAARPIAAPSANVSGGVSPTTAQHVFDSLDGRVSLVLDGGPCRIGIESTVIDLSGDQALMLRPGGVSREAIEAVIGGIAEFGVGGAPAKSPGLQDRHYAPGRPMRLNAACNRAGEAFLGFGRGAPAGARGDVMNLSPSGNVDEAAANLFAMIRALDRMEVSAIAVAPIPDEGLGRAINDRLRRAAGLGA
jgi:L-threonylcarbamoyladenylate synthase